MSLGIVVSAQRQVVTETMLGPATLGGVSISLGRIAFGGVKGHRRIASFFRSPRSRFHTAMATRVRSGWVGTICDTAKPACVIMAVSSDSARSRAPNRTNMCRSISNA